MQDPRVVLGYFGANVRRLRLERGMTQGALAEKVGLEPLTIRLLETARRRPSFDTIVALAHSLEVEIGTLFVEATLPQNPMGRPRKPR